jgi:ATP-binding cassette subfamily B multidrug efflux pump
MRSWFERLIAPLRNAPVERPPDQLVAFYRHFLEPVKGTIVTVLVISLVTALTEMG